MGMGLCVRSDSGIGGGRCRGKGPLAAPRLSPGLPGSGSEEGTSSSSWACKSLVGSAPRSVFLHPAFSSSDRSGRGLPAWLGHGAPGEMGREEAP